MKVILDLPDNLYKVLHAEALLQDITVEQNCEGRLKEVVESWLESDWPQEAFKLAYTPKKEDGGAEKT